MIPQATGPDLQVAEPAEATRPERSRPGRLARTVHWIGDNRMLVAGGALILFLVLFGVVGSVFVTPKQGDVGAGRPARPPDFQHLLGTDQQGRDVLANLIYGTPSTLKIGLIAGVVGVTVGTLLGLAAGFMGGTVDVFVRLATDVFLTIPSLMILVVIAAMFSGITVWQMGLIIALWAWMWPARTVRAQVLTTRERMYVHVARLNGMNTGKIIICEVMPNLMPFLAASFVGTVAAAILASIGLSALGTRAPERGVARADDLLGDLLRRAHPPALVVVLAADHHHHHPLRRPVHDHRRPRPHRQPASQNQRLGHWDQAAGTGLARLARTN